MSEDVARTDPTPPVQTDSAAAQTAATPEPNNAIEDRITGLESRLAEKDVLINQYQQALGRYVSATPAQRPAATSDDVESRFGKEELQFVTTVSQKVADRAISSTLGKLAIQAEAQQRLGVEPGLVAKAQQEYQLLLQNPYYANLSEEVLTALAAERARSSHLQSQLELSRKQAQTQSVEDARRAQAGSPTIPTNQPVPASAPAPEVDADLRTYMSNPDIQKSFLRFMSDVYFPDGSRITDANSSQEIRWGGKATKVSDVFRSFAVRAVRTGFQVSDQIGNVTRNRVEVS